MDSHHRHNQLLEILATRSRASVEELASELGVSLATVRRDLDSLAQQQLLTRTRGGAVAHGVSYALPLRYKAARAGDEKLRIARAAAEMVRPGDVIGLNGGTTATEVARAIALDPGLAQRAEEADGPVVTIVTNAVNIASELCVRPHVRMVVTGGTARPQSYELIGPLAVASLTEVYLDIAFMGVTAFDPALGAMADHEGEAEVNKLLVTRAERVVAVADASKLGQHAMAVIAPSTAFHNLITDEGAKEELVAEFRGLGITVQLA